MRKTKVAFIVGRIQISMNCVCLTCPDSRFDGGGHAARAHKGYGKKKHPRSHNFSPEGETIRRNF